MFPLQQRRLGCNWLGSRTGRTKTFSHRPSSLSHSGVEMGCFLIQKAYCQRRGVSVRWRVYGVWGCGEVTLWCLRDGNEGYFGFVASWGPKHSQTKHLRNRPDTNVASFTRFLLYSLSLTLVSDYLILSILKARIIDGNNNKASPCLCFGKKLRGEHGEM